MRYLIFALTLATLAAIPRLTAAQQSMPQSMPGMDMSQHTPHKPPPKKPMDAPMTQSAGSPPGMDDGSNATSITRAAQTIQEQENTTIHTGEDLSAPELLTDMATRTPMSIEDFLTLAEKSNPTLAQARANVTIAEQQGKQAGLAPNPTIGYSGDHIRGGSYGGGEQGAFIQQEIVLGGKLGLRRDVYMQQAKSNTIAIDEQRYRVRSTVQQAFYAALTNQDLVTAHQGLLRIALDTVESAHRLANLGQADAPDVLESEIDAEQAKIDYVHAQRDYLQAFQTLAAVAGAQHLAVAPLKGDLDQPPQIDAEQQIANIVAESPTVHRSQQDVAVAEAKLKSARREPVPNLTLRAGEYYSGEHVDGSTRAAGPESFAEASIGLPLWNRNQGNIAAAKAELERAAEEVTRTQLDLKRQAEPLIQHYLSARLEAERYRTQLLPRSQRAYDLYLMKYQQMAAAYPQVLNAKRSLFQLRIHYLQALNEEWMNAIALQNYTLSNGLEAPMRTSPDATTLNLPTGGGGQ